MNTAQAQLVYLLLCAIRGKIAEADRFEKADWNQILNYAGAHNIRAIIFSALPKAAICNHIDNEILEHWKKETIMTAIYQLQHIRQVESLIQKFNQRGIHLIVLKGLVIRNLYPKPEFRTMGDADILVRKSDLNAVKELMEGAGYVEGEVSPLHISYENISHNHVEVHWTIRHDRFFHGMDELESSMWESAVNINIGKSEALSFSGEDLAIHLCIHMATHILVGGFGLRQLCDLVLLVEKRGNLIDWTRFYEKLKKWRIEKFTAAIFLVCKILFDMNIPEEFNRYCNNFDSQLIQQLIEDILSGGVYGKRDLSGLCANAFAYGDKREQGSNFMGVIRRFVLYIFPPVSEMSDKYSYAKKYKILIVLAWLHHLISGIIRREFGIVDKIRFFTDTIRISIRRNKLLKNLGF